jgi:dihydroneopterin aldolase/D-erythro-7,8-dihydroneopterin triphosphate epimerase
MPQIWAASVKIHVFLNPAKTWLYFHLSRKLLGGSMATDQIHIKDLLVRTIIGINEDERRNKQDVVINITLYTDHAAAAASDDIADTVNYKTIAKQTIKLVEESQFYLVEKMALEIVKLCLADPRVERAAVTVEKPGALRFARSVGVTIERTRAEIGSTGK